MRLGVDFALELEHEFGVAMGQAQSLGRLADCQALRSIDHGQHQFSEPLIGVGGPVVFVVEVIVSNANELFLFMRLQDLEGSHLLNLCLII